MLSIRPPLLILAVGLAAAVVPAQQCLTTLFARNNGGSFGGAVYFDATVTNAIEVVSLETNTLETVPFTMTVWATAQGVSAFGNEADPTMWTQVAQDDGTAVGAGVDLPSVVDLAAPFQLDPGLYGIALVMGPTAGHDYTNGNGTNQAFSDANLALSLGSASNAPFTGGIFFPRVWNGSICYNLVPTSCADLTITGSGGPGTTLTFDLTGSEPEAPTALLIGPAEGTTTFALGPLGTIELGLALPFLVHPAGLTDGSGNLSVVVQLPNGSYPMANLFAQMLTLTFTLPPPGPPRITICTSDVEAFSVGS